MFVCSCRAISDRDYECPTELEARLLEDDIVCGSCVTELEHSALIPHGVNNVKEKT